MDDGEKTIAQDIVVTKYKMAGEMVNSMFPFFRMFILYLMTVNHRGAQATDREMRRGRKFDQHLHDGRRAAYRGDQQSIQKGEGTPQGDRLSDLRVRQQLHLPLFTVEE